MFPLKKDVCSVSAFFHVGLQERPDRKLSAKCSHRQRDCSRTLCQRAASTAKLDQLNDAHLRVVAAPVAVLEHARVATVAVGITLRDLLEQSVDELLVV